MPRKPSTPAEPAAPPERIKGTRQAGKGRGLYLKPSGADPKGPNWWILWYDRNGQRHREKAGTKSQAEALYQKRKVEDRQGKKLPELGPKRAELSVKELLEKYLPEIRTSKKDHAVDERIGKLWIEKFPERGVSTITPGDIEQVKATWIVDGLKPGTVNRRLAMLKTLLGKAVRDELLARNPLGQKRVKLLRESPPRERILTHEEEAAVIAELPRLDVLAVTIALHTGLRVTEQVTLPRASVDLRRRLIYLDETKGGGRQLVHLNDVAHDALKELLDSHKSRWIFPDPSGDAPLSRFSLTPRFAKACDKLTKLAKQKQGGVDLTGMTWHGLRHTFISRLVMLGTPLPTVQKLARHKSIQMTLRYSHLYPEQEQQALNTLGNAYPSPSNK